MYDFVFVYYFSVIVSCCEWRFVSLNATFDALVVIIRYIYIKRLFIFIYCVV